MIAPARRGGRPRNVNLCEVLNAIFYVFSTGCQWNALPKDLPPKRTAHYYFIRLAIIRIVLLTNQPLA